MPIHPSFCHLFGISWQNNFYFATQLTFGCRSSSKIFHSLSEALCWLLLNSRRVPFILHLLNDFLLISPPSDPSAQAISKLKSLFSSISVPLSEDNIIGPVNSIEFLGITLDTMKFEARIPPSKLDHIRLLINTFQVSSSITKRNLLSLLGHFNYSIRIITQGRSFISRLLQLSTTAKHLGSHINITAEERKYIKMWATLISHWNGLSILQRPDFSSSRFESLH
ncbi:UNVERIFIED_CONTAM: hypothetical protein FKN15_069653 [Acipenser sinensis]